MNLPQSQQQLPVAQYPFHLAKTPRSLPKFQQMPPTPTALLRLQPPGLRNRILAIVATIFELRAAPVCVPCGTGPSRLPSHTQTPLSTAQARTLARPRWFPH